MRPVAAPLAQTIHERVVCGPVFGVGPHAREFAAQALQAGSSVEQADEPRPLPREITRQQQRAVFADDAVSGVRPVAPVHENADERVIHRAELLDGFVGSREKTFDAIARTAEFFQGALQLDRGLLRVWLGQFVGFGAVIAGPENADFGCWTFLLLHTTLVVRFLRPFELLFVRNYAARGSSRSRIPAELCIS